jgi:hypothetical protein
MRTRGQNAITPGALPGWPNNQQRSNLGKQMQWRSHLHFDTAICTGQIAAIETCRDLPVQSQRGSATTTIADRTHEGTPEVKTRVLSAQS